MIGFLSVSDAKLHNFSAIVKPFSSSCVKMLVFLTKSPETIPK